MSLGQYFHKRCWRKLSIGKIKLGGKHQNGNAYQSTFYFLDLLQHNGIMMVHMPYVGTKFFDIELLAYGLSLLIMEVEPSKHIHQCIAHILLLVCLAITCLGLLVSTWDYLLLVVGWFMMYALVLSTPNLQLNLKIR